VAAQNGADLVPEGEHRVLLAVVEHPLGQQRTAAAHDPDHAVPHEGQVLAQDAGVDREVVDALPRLVLEARQDRLLVEVFDVASEDHRVDRHRSDRHRGVAHDGLPGGVEVAARRQVHHGVGAPAVGPAQLLDLLLGAAAHRRRAHVRVDLRQARASDRHRVEPLGEVVLVGGDHHATGRDLVAHLLRTEVGLALGDPTHLRCDLAQARVLELRDGREPRGRRPAPVDSRPVGGHEVPGGLVRYRGHARRVGRAEGEVSTHLLWVREAPGGRSESSARRVSADGGEPPGGHARLIGHRGALQ
jgi:hypothetical protein